MVRKLSLNINDHVLFSSSSSPPFPLNNYTINWQYFRGLKHIFPLYYSILLLVHCRATAVFFSYTSEWNLTVCLPSPGLLISSHKGNILLLFYSSKMFVFHLRTKCSTFQCSCLIPVWSFLPFKVVINSDCLLSVFSK